MSDWKSRNKAYRRLNEGDPWYLRRPGLTGWLIAAGLVVVILCAIKGYS